MKCLDEGCDKDRYRVTVQGCIAPAQYLEDTKEWVYGKPLVGQFAYCKEAVADFLTRRRTQ